MTSSLLPIVKLPSRIGFISGSRTAEAGGVAGVDAGRGCCAACWVAGATGGVDEGCENCGEVIIFDRMEDGERNGRRIQMAFQTGWIYKLMSERTTSYELVHRVL